MIKLVDFGVAKAGELLNTDDPDEGVTLVKTRSGDFVGTPRYSAPETVVGDPSEPNSDLFCVGLVVYEALVGQSLIKGTNQSELLNELVFPQPFDLSPVPEQWRPWLSQLLEKSPTHRIATAQEAIELLATTFPSLEPNSAVPRPATAGGEAGDMSDKETDEFLYPTIGQEELDLDEKETGEYDALRREGKQFGIADIYEPTVERPPPDMSEFETTTEMAPPAFANDETPSLAPPEGPSPPENKGDKGANLGILWLAVPFGLLVIAIIIFLFAVL